MTNAVPEPEASRPVHHALYWIVSILFAGVLLYFSLRGIEWNRVGQILLRARLPLVAVVCALGTATLMLRALRWRVLLLAEGRVSMKTAFWATSAGYFGNNFLPARAGELVRTFMISAGTKLSKTFVLTTALSERVADAIVLVTISAIVLLTVDTAGPSWLSQAARPFAILGMCGVAAIAVLPKLDRLWHAMLARVPLPDGLRSKLEHVLDHVLMGIRSFHDAGRLGRFFAFTIVIWMLDGFATVLGGQALGVPIRFPIALLLISGLGLGSALPSTPGYIGIYQFVAVSVLTPFGISRTDAIAYILFFQAVQYVLITACGLVGISQYRRVKAATLDPAPVANG
jgi:uncharacterized protein (TIRG00374 family)